MTTIRHVKAVLLARAIVAAAALLGCAPAFAQQSANDINRLPFPNRDLTRSIPPSGPTSAAPSQPMPGHPIVPPKHRPHRTVIHCAPVVAPLALSSCPAVVLGEEEEPAPEPATVPAPPPPPQPVTPSRPIIITHDMIADLQSRLHDAGAYSGPINGVFDFPTRNALIAWQRANGKKPTGSLNATTLEDFGITRP